MYGYDKMGNIRSVKRFGLAGKPSTFGVIDDLQLHYRGNQLIYVVDDATNESLYSGAFNVLKKQYKGIAEYKYNDNENLTQDSIKGIARICYNSLNLPSILQFIEGHYTEYLYDAAGLKRRVNQITTAENMAVPMGNMWSVSANNIALNTQTDYCGNVIYENRAVSTILVDGGYVTMSGTTPTYHYYIQDHQGNNRVVFNQSGTIEQTNSYYPFGMTFGEGIATSDQRYKYNGKELGRMHGLNLYDYGARHHDAAIGRWGGIDPLAEKRYSISPYTYCSNNPITRIDPTGMLDDNYSVDDEGCITLREITSDDYDVLYAETEDGSVDGTPGKSISVEKGVLKETKPGDSAEDIIQINTNYCGEALFEFLADNTSVEWELSQTGDYRKPEKGIDYIGTSHQKNSNNVGLLYDHIFSTNPSGEMVNVFKDIHNYPNGQTKASGFGDKKYGDNVFADLINGLYPNIFLYTYVKGKGYTMY